MRHRANTSIQAATKRELSFHVRTVESKKLYRRSVFRQKLRLFDY
jgi:hypothetical protein